MRAYVVTEDGPAFRDIPDPQPKPGQLLVRVAANALNRADLAMAAGHMHGARGGLGAVIGLEWAGEVVGLGEGVEDFAIGDRVMGGGGGFAELAAVPADSVNRLPDANMSFEEAACFPTALRTMHNAVVTVGALKAGETVLIHAGAGGVGHVAIQLARNVAARIATTVSGDEKARFAQSIGAEHTIDYKRENFVQRTLDWTGKRGADVVFDTLGGPTFCGSFDAVRVYGKLATLLSTPCELPQLNRLRLRNITVSYVQMTMPLYFGIHEFRCAQTRILEKGAALIDEGKLEVKVSEQLSLAEAEKAHRLLEEGHTFGKVVLAVE